MNGAVVGKVRVLMPGAGGLKTVAVGGCAARFSVVVDGARLCFVHRLIIDSEGGAGIALPGQINITRGRGLGGEIDPGKQHPKQEAEWEIASKYLSSRHCPT